jgi:CBS domain-containing protein
MSKTTRDVMTPGPPAEGDLTGGPAIAADDRVDEALRLILERRADSLAVIDGHELVGRVTPGELAISMEDTRTWSALCS